MTICFITETFDATRYGKIYIMTNLSFQWIHVKLFSVCLVKLKIHKLFLLLSNLLPFFRPTEFCYVVNLGDEKVLDVSPTSGMELPRVALRERTEHVEACQLWWEDSSGVLHSTLNDMVLSTGKDICSENRYHVNALLTLYEQHFIDPQQLY